MRIIQAAKRKEESVKTCYKCRSVFGIELGDQHYDNADDRYYVNCPICGTSISILAPDKEFPWELKEVNEVQGDNSMRVNSF